MSLPEAGLLGSGLALASLWWNRAACGLRNWGLAAVEGWLLVVALPRERAEQRRDSLHLKAVEHLDSASIWAVEKVWLWLQTAWRFHWKTETQAFSMKVKPLVSQRQYHPPLLRALLSVILHLISQIKEKNTLTSFFMLDCPDKTLYLQFNPWTRFEFCLN